MVREGFRDEALHSRTPWLCASCYACTVNCPAGIHITDVMYALKRVAIKEGAYPKRFPVPVLAKEFRGEVTRTGRTNELALGLSLALKTNPLRLLKMAPLGLKLLKTRRLSIRSERVRDPRALDDLLRRVHEATP
jgi:quinone-modifying oxidoreductase subunit QmoC